MSPQTATRSSPAGLLLALLMAAALCPLSSTQAASSPNRPSTAAQSGTTGATVNGVVHEGNTTIEFDSAASARDLNEAELKGIDQLRQRDPAAVRELAKNPRLVEDETFVDRHPALKDFLTTHPDARKRIVANPGEFLPPPSARGWPH